MRTIAWLLLINAALSPLGADEHVAVGKIEHAGSTMSFRASLAVWIPELNRLRLFLLPHQPSDAERDSLREASQKPWGIHEALKGKQFTEVEFQFKDSRKRPAEESGERPVEDPSHFTSDDIDRYSVSVYAGKERPHSTTTSLLVPPTEFKLFTVDIEQQSFEIQAEGNAWSLQGSSPLWIRDSRGK